MIKAKESARKPSQDSGKFSLTLLNSKFSGVTEGPWTPNNLACTALTKGIRSFGYQT